MPEKDKKITGTAGAAPPPDAPQESAQPLSPEAIQQMSARARANEQTLPPFAPKATQRIAAPGATPAPAAAQPDAAVVDRLVDEFFGDDAPPASAPAPPKPSPVTAMPSASLPTHDPLLSADVDQLQDEFPAPPPLTAEQRARMPAASDSDTPAKGLLQNLVPKPDRDKFEGISRGGFTDVGEAQYFPLTGDELLELSLALADTLTAQIRNDLRFSFALTYPRVRVRLVLEVDGSAEDNAGFAIEKVHMPKAGQPGSTAVEIARTRGNDVVFVVTAARQEFTHDGDVDRPPDALREELGLPIPRKQIVTQGGMSSMVDVAAPGADLRAVTQ